MMTLTEIIASWGYEPIGSDENPAYGTLEIHGTDFVLTYNTVDATPDEHEHYEVEVLDTGTFPNPHKVLSTEAVGDVTDLRHTIEQAYSVYGSMRRTEESS